MLIISPGNATVPMVAKPILRARSPLVAQISMALELLPLLNAKLSLNARL